MNTQQPLLLIVSLLVISSSYADEKNTSQSSFPPSDFSVEKSTAAVQKNKNTVIPTVTGSTTTANNGSPWVANTTPVPAVAKQYPPTAATMPSPYNYNKQKQGYPAFQQPNFQPPFNAFPPRTMGYQMPNTNFANISPFGNTFSPNTMFNNGTMPTPWSNIGGINPWRNNNNSALPPYFLNPVNTGKKKSWGDIRHIWPDFYTDFTDEVWDKSMNAPYDMGRMPGGWRAPSLSSPDPVTVGDAVTNQFPPMLEEMGNMMNFAN